MSDPYIYPGTKVLINKFDIRDPEKLEQLEAAIYYDAFKKPLPVGKFDYDHLKAIHKHFFGQLYDWAGQERTINFSKGNSFFGNHEFIAKELTKIFKKLAQEQYLTGLEKSQFCERLSLYFNDINAAHPFREGNGRTLRAFSDELAKQASYIINWDKVSKEQYTSANIEGFKGDETPLTQVFKQIISPKKFELQVTKVNIEQHDLGNFIFNSEQQKTQYSVLNQLIKDYPIIAECETLIKKRAKLAGFQAEQVDKLIKLRAIEIINNKNLYQALQNTIPELLKSLIKLINNPYLSKD